MSITDATATELALVKLTGKSVAEQRAMTDDEHIAWYLGLVEKYPQRFRIETCKWFAMCDQPAVGTVEHPVLGPVPTCQRCADKLGLRLVFS